MARSDRSVTGDDMGPTRVFNEDVKAPIWPNKRVLAVVGG